MKMVPFFRFDFFIISYIFHVVILTLASFLKNYHRNVNICKYYNHFCIQIKKIIKINSLINLMYTSYIMIMYDYLSCESLENSLISILQFCRIVEVLNFEVNFSSKIKQV